MRGGSTSYTIRERLILAGIEEIRLHGLQDFPCAKPPLPAVSPVLPLTNTLRIKTTLFSQLFNTFNSNGIPFKIRFWWNIPVIPAGGFWKSELPIFNF